MSMEAKARDIWDDVSDKCYRSEHMGTDYPCRECREKGCVRLFNAGMEEAAKVAGDMCIHLTRRCDPKIEKTCLACDIEAAIREKIQ